MKYIKSLKYLFLLLIFISNVANAGTNTLINKGNGIVDIGSINTIKSGAAFYEKKTISIAALSRLIDREILPVKRKEDIKDCLSDPYGHETCSEELTSCNDNANYNAGSATKHIGKDTIPTISSNISYRLNSTLPIYGETSAWPEPLKSYSIKNDNYNFKFYAANSDNYKFSIEIDNYGKYSIDNGEFKNITSWKEVNSFTKYLSKGEHTIQISGDGDQHTDGTAITIKNSAGNLIWNTRTGGQNITIYTCPIGYYKLNNSICEKDYIYYTYSCPTDIDQYGNSWKGPLVNSGGDCQGNGVSQSKGGVCPNAGPTPPAHNCMRYNYSCPINSSFQCIAGPNTNEIGKNIFNGYKYEIADSIKFENILLKPFICPDYPGINYSCETGWTLNGNICEKIIDSTNIMVPVNGVCNEGYKLIDNKCYKEIEGTEFTKNTNGQIVYTKYAGNGYNKNLNSCSAPKKHECQYANYSYDKFLNKCIKAPNCEKSINGHCYSKPNRYCKSGYSYDSTTKKCIKYASCSKGTLTIHDINGTPSEVCESNPTKCNTTGFTLNTYIENKCDKNLDTSPMKCVDGSTPNAAGFCSNTVSPVKTYIDTCSGVDNINTECIHTQSIIEPSVESINLNPSKKVCTDHAAGFFSFISNDNLKIRINTGTRHCSGSGYYDLLSTAIADSTLAASVKFTYSAGCLGGGTIEVPISDISEFKTSSLGGSSFLKFIKSLAPSTVTASGICKKKGSQKPTVTLSNITLNKCPTDFHYNENGKCQNDRRPTKYQCPNGYQILPNRDTSDPTKPFVCQDILCEPGYTLNLEAGYCYKDLGPNYQYFFNDKKVVEDPKCTNGRYNTTTHKCETNVSCPSGDSKITNSLGHKLCSNNPLFNCNNVTGLTYVDNNTTDNLFNTSGNYLKGACKADNPCRSGDSYQLINGVYQCTNSKFDTKCPKGYTLLNINGSNICFAAPVCDKGYKLENNQCVRKYSWYEYKCDTDNGWSMSNDIYKENRYTKISIKPTKSYVSSCNNKNGCIKNPKPVSLTGTIELISNPNHGLDYAEPSNSGTNFSSWNNTWKVEGIPLSRIAIKLSDGNWYLKKTSNGNRGCGESNKFKYLPDSSYTVKKWSNICYSSNTQVKDCALDLIIKLPAGLSFVSYSDLESVASNVFHTAACNSDNRYNEDITLYQNTLPQSGVSLARKGSGTLGSKTVNLKNIVKYIQYSCPSKYTIIKNVSSTTDPYICTKKSVYKSGGDCHGSCGYYGCSCNSAVAPANSCRKPVTLGSNSNTYSILQKRPMVVHSISGNTLDPKEMNVKPRGYQCSKNGKKCEFAVTKVYGEENNLCFEKANGEKSCFAAKGCSFIGSIDATNYKKNGYIKTLKLFDPYTIVSEYYLKTQDMGIRNNCVVGSYDSNTKTCIPENINNYTLWTQTGDKATWLKKSIGTDNAMEQTVNTNNFSFYLYPKKVGNATISGDIAVAPCNDDDTIGLVWAYQDTKTFYGLMWSRSSVHTGGTTIGGGGNVGLRLVKVKNGTITELDKKEDSYGWGCTNSNTPSVSDFTKFTVKISGKNIKVYKGNNLIFNYTNATNIPAGKMGYFGVSQADSWYKNFSIQTDPTCPLGSTYDSRDNHCHKNATCPKKYLFNPDTKTCQKAISSTCKMNGQVGWTGRTDPIVSVGNSKDIINITKFNVNGNADWNDGTKWNGFNAATMAIQFSDGNWYTIANVIDSTGTVVSRTLPTHNNSHLKLLSNSNYIIDKSADYNLSCKYKNHILDSDLCGDKVTIKTPKPKLYVTAISDIESLNNLYGGDELSGVEDNDNNITFKSVQGNKIYKYSGIGSIESIKIDKAESIPYKDKDFGNINNRLRFWDSYIDGDIGFIEFVSEVKPEDRADGFVPEFIDYENLMAKGFTSIRMLSAKDAYLKKSDQLALGKTYFIRTKNTSNSDCNAYASEFGMTKVNSSSFNVVSNETLYKTMGIREPGACILSKPGILIPSATKWAIKSITYSGNVNYVCSPYTCVNHSCKIESCLKGTNSNKFPKGYSIPKGACHNDKCDGNKDFVPFCGKVVDCPTDSITADTGAAKYSINNSYASVYIPFNTHAGDPQGDIQANDYCNEHNLKCDSHTIVGNKIKITYISSSSNSYTESDKTKKCEELYCPKGTLNIKTKKCEFKECPKGTVEKNGKCIKN